MASLPQVLVPEQWLSVVLAELTTQRRARIASIHSSQDGNTITASAPMATLTVSCLITSSLCMPSNLPYLQDYSTVLRSLTSGTGSFSALFSHYEPLSRSQQAALLVETRGYPD